MFRWRTSSAGRKPPQNARTADAGPNSSVMHARPVSRLAGLAQWIAREARRTPPIERLHGTFCRGLRRRGFPLWRSSLGLEVLHPELSGPQYIWVSGRLALSEFKREGIAESPSYLNSPTFVVDTTGRQFRRRLTRSAPDMPLLDELRAEGATDYVIYPLPFEERKRTAVISFATRQKGGFNRHDIQELAAAATIFSPYAERHVLRRVAIDLLDTYVGAGTGRRIFEGRIERGSVETIQAAILLCDLRGFTKLSDRVSREEVVTTLNAWFDVMTDAVETHGGEVLKFLGDGLLAMFPVSDDPGPACDRAVDAATSAMRGVEGLNALRRALGSKPVRFGLAVHLGEVAYGNIGGRRRLDFTLIGPVVNHASRLQELTKRLGHTVLVSAEVAAYSTRPLVSLGPHQLRDLAAAQQIHGLPAERPRQAARVRRSRQSS